MAHAAPSRRLALLLGLAVVTGCGGDTSSSPPTSSPGSTAPTRSTVAPSSTSAPESAVGETPVRGGKLVIGVEAEVGNPWVPAEMNCDSSCIVRARTFFEPLFATGDDGVMRPWLAEKLEVNDNSTAFTITLRPGITFHDGTPLDAEAAIENLQRYAASGLVGRGLADLAKNPDGTAKVDVLGPLSYRIYTSRPWYDFPQYLDGFVASPTWLRAVDADRAKAAEPVGTGPFRFVSWRPGDNLVVRRHPGYWRNGTDGQPLPYLDELEFRVIPDELTRARALENGFIDLMPTDSGENIAHFRGADDLRLIEQSDRGETWYVLLHVGQEGSPLQDQRVRCALVAATDTEAVSEISGGITPPANGLFSPGQDGYLDDNGNPGYDPERARQLVAEYTAEKGKPKIIFSTIPDTTPQQVAALFQQQWGAVGIDVEIAVVEQSALILNALLGVPEFQAFGWRNHSGSVVDEQYVWWHKATSAPTGQLALNFGRLDDPVINDLLDRQRSEPDPAQRAEYAKQINRRFAEQCWVVPLTWAVWGVVMGNHVRGVSEVTFPDSADLPRYAAGQFSLTTAWRAP